MLQGAVETYIQNLLQFRDIDLEMLDAFVEWVAQQLQGLGSARYCQNV
jgi:hypothetical protein